MVRVRQLCSAPGTGPHGRCPNLSYPLLYPDPTVEYIDVRVGLCPQCRATVRELGPQAETPALPIRKEPTSADQEEAQGA